MAVPSASTSSVTYKAMSALPMAAVARSAPVESMVANTTRAVTRAATGTATRATISAVRPRLRCASRRAMRAVATNGAAFTAGPVPAGSRALGADRRGR